jgi:hypothetical protein
MFLRLEGNFCWNSIWPTTVHNGTTQHLHGFKCPTEYDSNILPCNYPVEGVR